MRQDNSTLRQWILKRAGLRRHRLLVILPLTSRLWLSALGNYLVDLVTSSYHTRRSGSIYRSPAPGQYFTPEGWWKTREGEQKFLQAFGALIA